MALIDSISIELLAGRGGDGVVRWRKEKYIPRGGPAGGDGGRGGSIYVIGVKDNTYLERYAGMKQIKAPDGQNGGAKSLHGLNGEDVIIKVPVGTVVKNLDSDSVYDVLDVETPLLLLDGGRGGLGNERFKSSTNQAPYEQTDGSAGQSASFLFELRLIADAGLIGFPNAGKSTLINFLTNSKSKIADYQFTTLEPHLGMMDDFVLADIPGLIEGAAVGKGLGHKFLQHIERTTLLIHCISLDGDDISKDYQDIRAELVNYNPKLGEKSELIVLTKADLVDEKKIKKSLKLFPNAFVVSVLEDELLEKFKKHLSIELGKITTKQPGSNQV